ncbi:MAG TPA: DinB family protein [Blastocatellia bacterium]|nr:DinB family protein [Blastocatellia bacterium]
MEDLTTTISNGLARHYNELLAKVHQWAEPLNEEQFWTKPHNYGNSYGHLVLHLTGNLNYYIGAQIAETGYVRDRPREFTEPNPPAKAEALQRLDEAAAMVVRTLHAQTAEDWDKPYSAVGDAEAGNRFNIFLRCASHLYHHIGQMIYLHRAWTQQS